MYIDMAGLLKEELKLLPILDEDDRAALDDLQTSHTSDRDTIITLFRLVKRLGLALMCQGDELQELKWQNGSLTKQVDKADLELFRLNVQLFDTTQSIKDNMVMLEANGRMTDEQKAIDNTMQVIFNLLQLNRRNSFKRDRWSSPTAR